MRSDMDHTVLPADYSSLSRSSDTDLIRTN